ncbi:hypothetical protein [Mycolicibacterium duvalii]|nr:hypothetical protein [Mycolicibacterium duvalii]MCV7366820.1 hypothetical protein [Mycolicibacterium duvalii]
MRCIQDTTSRLVVVEWPGVAPDEAFDDLGDVLSRRLHIAAGQGRRCCASETELVAVAADDTTLPPATQAALQVSGPGRAVASTALAEVHGGWIAVPGLDIRVVAQTDLGGPAIAISYDDAATILAGDRDGRLLVRTVAVVAATAPGARGGWRVVGSGLGEVPVSTALVRGHRAGCAA